ncbi:hypothetical protein KKD49_06720 [Myxococcota bacterium]|nr:hypothetical protein [Myxococcota bacterium]
MKTIEEPVREKLRSPGISAKRQVARPAIKGYIGFTRFSDRISAHMVWGYYLITPFTEMKK